VEIGCGECRCAAGRAAAGKEASVGGGAIRTLAAHLVTLHYAHVACMLIAPA
jgi:hypothetical protein